MPRVRCGGEARDLPAGRERDADVLPVRLHPPARDSKRLRGPRREDLGDGCMSGDIARGHIGDVDLVVFADPIGIAIGLHRRMESKKGVHIAWDAILTHAPPGALVKALSGHEDDREAMEALERVRVELSRECRRSLWAAIAMGTVPKDLSPDGVRLGCVDHERLRAELADLAPDRVMRAGPASEPLPEPPADVDPAAYRASKPNPFRRALGLKGPVGPVPAPEDDEYGEVGPK
jgi:hypothetical protein